MRTALLAAAAAAALASASLAAAQEPRQASSRGRVGVDVIAAPAFGLGIPIRLTRQLTLRATAGLGSAVAGGAAFDVGGDLRYTLQPDASWSAYASVQASYLYASSGTGYARYSASTFSGGGDSAGLFGVGLGLRRQLGSRTSAYGELRYGRLTSTGVYDSWGMWGVGGANTVSLALGATFGL
jgi:hypothetical protein